MDDMLETLIDAYGIHEVLQAIAQLCEERSERDFEYGHARTGRAWHVAGAAIQECAESDEVLEVNS